MKQGFIQFESITKRFGGATALEGVSLSISRGQCHALMGENGAGKSTLGKILAGIHRPDAGRVIVDGTPLDFRSPRDARRAGVAMVYQELAFCPDLSVAENLCMGQYPRRFGMVSRRLMLRRAAAFLDRIGVSLDVSRPMRALSTAQEQLVQIASAVATDARVLIFDEPTSSLSEPEAQSLFALIEQLNRAGVTMIYVSHRMPEVFRLCDTISVLRDGRHVGDLERSQATHDAVVRLMIGRSVEQYVPQRARPKESQVLLSVRGLSSPGRFDDVSFDLRAGEILGLAGLVGAGRSEVACAVFGLDRRTTGKIDLEGRPLRLRAVRRAMARGIGLVPEDRKRQGLVLGMSGRANLSMATLKRLSRMGLLDRRTERQQALKFFDQLRVRASSIEAPVMSMSGGNQQKVVLGKWLARAGKVLIVDEPTRGVDIGAKTAIHALLDELAGKGMGIILISSELPEVLGLSSRVIVMREGRMVAERRKKSKAERSRV
ncbi:MAG: sugar ABC transporter ATP-binding protein, partial [Tepidisphaeraceae bacterium]